jgi:uncharacterized protein YqgV (UPF0045/DUF77 family)
MINEPGVNTRGVLVELTVISPNGNRHMKGVIPDGLDILERSGLFYEQTHNVICIEGEWIKISDIIHEYYKRVQAQSPQGFIKVSIR